MRACSNFPEIMLDRLYRPVFIRHIVSVMLLLTQQQKIYSKATLKTVSGKTRSRINNPLFIH